MSVYIRGNLHGVWDQARSTPAILVGCSIVALISACGRVGFDTVSVSDIDADPAQMVDASSEFSDASRDWWDTNWDSRIALQLNNLASNEELINFPILIHLHPGVFDYSAAEADGSDLRFVAGDAMTMLAHEVESFVPGGDSYIWVMVPRVFANSDQTSVWLYCGNSAPGLARPPSEVWINYAAVWHLNEPTTNGQTGGTLSDSTNMGNDGAQVGHEGVPALLAGGQEMVPDEYVRVPDAPSLDIVGPITLSAWVKLPAANSGYGALVSKYHLGNQRSYSLYLYDMEPRFVISQDGSNTDVFVTSSTDLSPDVWHYLSGSWDGSSNADALNLYLDGMVVGQASGPTVLTIHSSAVDVQLGCAFQPLGLVQCIRGILDEARISSLHRSGDWVSAEYLAMTDAFVVYGALETFP